MIRRLFVVLLVMCAGWDQPAGACTGITLVSKDGARVLARTIEWGGSNLNSRYVVVPRGYTQPILLPGGNREHCLQRNTVMSVLRWNRKYSLPKE